MSIFIDIYRLYSPSLKQFYETCQPVEYKHAVECADGVEMYSSHMSTQLPRKNLKRMSSETKKIDKSPALSFFPLKNLITRSSKLGLSSATSQPNMNIFCDFNFILLTVTLDSFCY